MLQDRYFAQFATFISWITLMFVKPVLNGELVFSGGLTVTGYIESKFNSCSVNG